MAEKTTNYNLTKPSADDFYDIGVQNGNMDIVDAELKKLNTGKAPSGHGLGAYAFGIADATLLDALKRGCGFYQIQNATDTPSTSPAWINLLQSLRGVDADGRSTGFQIAAFDYWKDEPHMWFRTIISNNTSAWNEMLHTGNYSNYANARISMGSYVGAIANSVDSEVVLSFDFVPKLIILRGRMGTNSRSGDFTATFMYGIEGHYLCVYNSDDVGSLELPVVWEGNSVKFRLWGTISERFNYSGNTYTYVAIG